jgi:hypothetical protein
MDDCRPHPLDPSGPLSAPLGPSGFICVYCLDDCRPSYDVYCIVLHCIALYCTVLHPHQHISVCVYYHLIVCLLLDHSLY